jgi:uncharacterized protein YukE
MAPPKDTDFDAKELTTQAGLLKTASTDLNTKLRNALFGLIDLGHFWGDDDIGQQFLNGDGKPGYSAQIETANKDVTAIATGYHTIADGFLQMAKNIDVANWDTIVSLPKVPE